MEVVPMDMDMDMCLSPQDKDGDHDQQDMDTLVIGHGHDAWIAWLELNCGLPIPAMLHKVQQNI
jgi:hypothetical protein